MKKHFYPLLFCLLYLSNTCLGQVPGSLDSTFNNVGFAVTSTGLDDDGEAVAVGPNGNIYVGGATENGGNYNFLYQAYQSDGSIDMSFGVNGALVEPSGSGNGAIQAIAVQADGNIVSVGFEESADVFQIFRHLPDGSRDSSFAQTGHKIVSLGDDESGATDVLIQPDGKIVVGIVSGNQSGIFLVAIRYNQNGTADSTFGFNGLVYTNIMVEAEPTHLALQPDGKLLLAGTTSLGQNIGYIVARFSQSGIPDSSFGAYGVVETYLNQNVSCTAIAMGLDKSIFLAGTTDGGASSQFSVVKMDSTGMHDSGFITQNGLMTNIGTGDAFCNGMEILANGSILLGGDAEDTSQVVFTMVKLLADGSRDTTFAPNGVLQTPIGNEEDLCNAMTIQPDGKVLLAGESDDGNGDSDIAVARYFNGCIVGMAEVASLPEILVYPHPLQDRFTLEFMTSTTGLVGLQMLDLQGRHIAELISPTSFASGQHRRALELPHLSPGIYFLRLSTPEGISTIKVVK